MESQKDMTVSESNCRFEKKVIEKEEKIDYSPLPHKTR